ncbi:hypothetical protein OHB05_42640 [Streptomyces sp. NBC_00638]|uniref:hypothetical protein n=1 Tax=Streptomyces sp. NBC_00638 TaxID=2975794 RepID=UPI00224D6442|nr:hypothetical protein [Streptomyces sp. NBC_00638]MCX5009216.1 hypothetical protein [Streptomyces sp. NBC_00638]
MSESDDEYWVDLFQDDDLLGGAFFVTRHYAMTLTDCVAALATGARIELRMVDEQSDGLHGEIVDVQPESGLALISVIAHPGQCIPIPRMDHVTKGDDWRAPYLPPRVRRQLRGTVDDIVHDHPQDGPCRTAIHLAADAPVRNHAAYGGGPVERITTETEPSPLVGVLMSPTSPPFSHSAPHDVVATSIDSALEAFPGLSAMKLATSLITGESASRHTDIALVPAHEESASETVVHAGAHLSLTPEHGERDSGTAVLEISPTAEPSAWSPDEIRNPVLHALCTEAEDFLRFLDYLGDSNLVDPLDLDAFRVQRVDDLTKAMRALQTPVDGEGGKA